MPDFSVFEMNVCLSDYSCWEQTSFGLSGWGKTWASTLIKLLGATETDNNLLSSSTFNISKSSTPCHAMCVQLSPGWGRARLLIMKLKITKSNYSPISSQKILCPELPSPRLYLGFSFPLPSFPSSSLASYVSLSLFPLACLLCWRCSRQNDITTLASGLQCSKAQCIRTVCVCACKSRHVWDQHPSDGRLHLKDHNSKHAHVTHYF